MCSVIVSVVNQKVTKMLLSKQADLFTGLSPLGTKINKNAKSEDNMCPLLLQVLMFLFIHQQQRSAAAEQSQATRSEMSE